MPTTLLWDELGSRFYEGGVDRGVLYLDTGFGVAWSGLISVNEGVSSSQRTPLYFDGIKYGESAAVTEFVGNIRCYTFPDEFMEYEGMVEIGDGLHVTNQPTKRFGLSYRTLIGNDEDGFDHGYKIHVIYNLTAVSAARNYQSMDSNIDPIQFEWSLTSIPATVPGYHPTSHFIIDSRKISPDLLSDIEATLYGDGSSPAKLPSAANLAGFIGTWVIIRITDNFDGTWTAEGDDTHIVQDGVDPTLYSIIGANVQVIDADTYTISDTTF